MNKPRIRHKLIKRKEIFERDGHKCLCCKAKEDLTVDHIIPKAQGGSNEDDNLQTLCERCNMLKGSHIISLKNLKVLLNPKVMQKRYANLLTKLAGAQKVNSQQVIVLDEYRNRISDVEHKHRQTNKRVIELQKENSEFKSIQISSIEEGLLEAIKGKSLEDTLTVTMLTYWKFNKQITPVIEFQKTLSDRVKMLQLKIDNE